MLKSNFILIRPDADNDRAGNFYLDTSMRKFTHTSVIGTVVSVPAELIYYGREAHEIRSKGRIRSQKEQDMLGFYNQYSTAFDVPVEVKEGDRVMYKTLAVDSAPVKGDIVPIRYDNLILRFNNGIYPLNGYVLVEPVETDWMGEAVEAKGRGIVAHVGCQVRHYRDFPTVKDYRLETGEEVMYMNTYNIPVEHSLHQKLDKRYFYMHRRNILCVSSRT